MENLPDELVLDVLRNCQVSDLQSLALVSKQFNRAAISLRAGLYCINELEEQSCVRPSVSKSLLIHQVMV